MKEKNFKVIGVFIVAALLVAVDQLTKYLAVLYLKPKGRIPIIGDFFRLTYVENKGAAFGMLQNQRWFFIGITGALLLAAAVLILRYRYHTWASYVCGALVISGGIGNLIDRIVNGFVVDFLSFSIFPPVFNFADCCVTLGAFFFIYHMLWAEKRQKEPVEMAEEAAEAARGEQDSLEKEEAER